MRGLLEQALGVRGARPAVAPEEIRVPPSRLADPPHAELAGVVGADNVRTGREARTRHARGRSTTDLLRMRAGDADDAPDAVVLPASHEEVLAVLRICARERIAVVPFGGGTSVVGGLTPARAGFAAVVALDLARMDRLLELDAQSRTATFEPGVGGPLAEELLAAHELTIGHFPQSFEYATLGGFAAARSSGQSSAGYGRFDDLVVALRLAAPSGTLELGRAPKSAAGPDLRQLVLGSEGTLGVITALTVKVTRRPRERVYEGWRFASFAAGRDALRRLAQDGPLPTVLRLSDETETALNLSSPADVGAPGSSGGCLAIVGHEGAAVAAVRAQTAETLRALGGEPLGEEPGARWAAGRFEGPYLRDALLDAGALVETLETAAFWSKLGPLHDAVTQALRDSLTAQGTPPVILCHVSHVYPTGASLYYTVACAQLDDPLAQWAQAKSAASESIATHEGAITHHHGVGVDHTHWYREEIGELGVRALRAVKDAWDPEGVMNPGVLLGS
jgi:alkyldihydroxyacetonephosphate synthase